MSEKYQYSDIVISMQHSDFELFGPPRVRWLPDGRRLNGQLWRPGATQVRRRSHTGPGCFTVFHRVGRHGSVRELQCAVLKPLRVYISGCLLFGSHNFGVFKRARRWHQSRKVGPHSWKSENLGVYLLPWFNRKMYDREAWLRACLALWLLPSACRVWRGMPRFYIARASGRLWACRQAA